ncbi:16265_t:CDS:2, partial [Acaulospora morrowiae]
DSHLIVLGLQNLSHSGNEVSYLAITDESTTHQPLSSMNQGLKNPYQKADERITASREIT